MDDLIRTILAWPARGEKGDSDVYGPPDLRIDSTAAVVALLVERAGVRVAFSGQEITEVASRLLLLPRSTDEGISLEVRLLARAPHS